jgi:hypothetical protein
MIGINMGKILAKQLTKSIIENKYNGKPQVKQLEVSAGDNLYLIVSKVGKCTWKYSVRKNGQATWVVIGELDMFSLDEAVVKAKEYKKIANEGFNPNKIKQQQLNKQITISQLIEI